ncbi:acetyltransferase [Fictibacillus macauensis ZFHKF-1]|uniref:Acetyltransferase n=1 Tax=Fictibacillus macauensis ZFHKF-1 TaxID=1196324 RepID=I8AEH8_9BACL|nr:GNAT family N-acetyltransferase [Fictibacillus macauensis]EIT83739.1 acetyltransferase [Fictibacillus macauensis ZFHKF-1]
MITHNEKVESFQLSYPQDLQGLLALSASVGWDYDEHELTTILHSGSVFGHKLADGTLISSAAIIPYDHFLASIGLVIVQNAYRGFGLGKEVMQRCMNSVANDTSILLISTEAGKQMYESIGFMQVDSVHKYMCETYLAKEAFKTAEPGTIEAYSLEDFPASYVR